MSAAASLAVIAATLLTAACASQGIPPGGPPDKAAPALVGISPDSGAVNVRPRSIMLRFDEVVNERSTPLGGNAGSAFGGGGSLNSGGLAGGGFGAGGSGFGGSGMGSSLSQLVLLSPGDGREKVIWRRTAIEIEPRGGFRANTTYRLTLLPGLSDLRGNILREPVDVVFSTGATRTEASIHGAIFDWVGGKPAPGARIEVFAPADTMLRWMARADSSGRFVVRDLAPGTYRLRGWGDGNNNRALDPREVFDSATVTVDSSTTAELYAFLHDTVGPRIETLEPLDSTALRVKFDRGVALDWRPDSATIVLMRSDSTLVPVGEMVPAAAFDSLAKLVAATADSVKRAADTTAAPKDTVKPPAAAAAAPPAGGRRPPRMTIVRAGGDTLPKDTVRVPPPELRRAVPVTQWVVRFGAPLPPGEYRLKVSGVRGLTGAIRPSEREFRLRAPAAPRDSAQAAPARPRP